MLPHYFVKKSKSSFIKYQSKVRTISRHAKGNNKYMKDYDENKESLYLK